MADKDELIRPRPCQFCGEIPLVQPENPDRDGDTWGMVSCINRDCPAQPRVLDGESVADNRGSGAYINAAIRRWNGPLPDQKDELIARLRKQVQAAMDIVNRGVDLMTPTQIGKWQGVRAFLEQDEDAYTEGE